MFELLGDVWAVTGTGIIGAVIAALGALLKARRQQAHTQQAPETLDVAKEIDREIEKKRAVVERLQQDAETYSRVKELNQAELEAVSQVLAGELRKEGRRSFWVNFTTNFAFFILGAIVSVITTLLIGN